MHPSQPNVLARLAAVVKSSKQGVDTLLDWLGNGGEPVDFRDAHRRARICKECPLNRKTRWWEFVKIGVAKFIRQQESIRLGADMVTIFDDRLGTCKACKCYLKLKVWVPISHIMDNLDPAQFNKLDPNCWVRKEDQK